jgi:hypothetical protein
VGLLIPLAPFRERRVREARARLRLVPASEVREGIERLALEHVREREARQKVRRSGGPQARCGVCHRFKASHGGRCRSCGYLPGVGFPA